MNSCWRSCGSANRRRPDGPNCGSGWRWSTAWRTSAAGKAGGPATGASARICSTCAASRSSTISMSSFTIPRISTPWPLDYWTGVLVSSVLVDGDVELNEVVVVGGLGDCPAGVDVDHEHPGSG